MSKAKYRRFLPGQTQVGTQLRGSLFDFEIAMLEWSQNLLPEHIWIASLIGSRGPDGVDLYKQLVTALDAYFVTPRFALGFVSDFGEVPETERMSFKQRNRELIYEAFYKPIGRALAFYPDGPAYWIIPQDSLEKDGPLNPRSEIGRLNALVGRLLDGRSFFAGNARTLPLERILKHSPQTLPLSEDFIEQMKKYPGRLDRFQCLVFQQKARTIIRSLLHSMELNWEWSKYFWRHNYDLITCVPLILPVGKPAFSEIEAECIPKAINHNSNIALDYLRMVALGHKTDLYDPTRDEVLLGLFARITRLFVFVTTSMELWAVDVLRILLRCMVDSVIVLSYLAQKGTHDEFHEFVRYGLGKRKLLALHLKHNYPNASTLDGSSAVDLVKQLGGEFNAEFLKIELDNWTKKSMRELAIDGGTESFYRLVYDPASSDVHGTWSSLAECCLTPCGRALHRHHLLPIYNEAPPHIEIMLSLRKLYEFVVNIGIAHLGWPKLPDNLLDPTKDFPLILKP